MSKMIAKKTTSSNTSNTSNNKTESSNVVIVLKKDVSNILKNWENIQTISKKTPGKNVQGSYNIHPDDTRVIQLEPTLSREEWDGEKGYVQDRKSVV